MFTSHENNSVQITKQLQLFPLESDTCFLALSQHALLSVPHLQSPSSAASNTLPSPSPSPSAPTPYRKLLSPRSPPPSPFPTGVYCPRGSGPHITRPELAPNQSDILKWVVWKFKSALESLPPPLVLVRRLLRSPISFTSSPPPPPSFFSIDAFLFFVFYHSIFLYAFIFFTASFINNRLPHVSVLSSSFSISSDISSPVC